MLFISTVSYSVRVYGPDTDAENINSVAVRIIGKDDSSTKLKYLTDKATEGYEMYLKHLEYHQKCSASRKKKKLLRVVFSTLFSVLDIPMKHCLLRLIYDTWLLPNWQCPGRGEHLRGCDRTCSWTNFVIWYRVTYLII